ncbi:putative transcription factor WD40-like family [Lupinus albus]|uniref:Putative transcription factor WD40-like family n=1 Tax=Lupinus albus TaxID=3870 RepID=A0A6A4NS02_LUPAL|nr:putative transcription factor WD40-like family [Lupinus albus]
MAKRGYKIQEFMAHSGAVNCLKIGKKECRRFVTGGEDHKVNLWTIGKPTYLMSLSGHNSSVQSLDFDSAEVLVLGGASSGVIKLWDLEEAKMVRTVAGQRSSCTAIEFHPFGEFFASGYMDANVKIWDIRKKGCIHTYKGHSQGISSIKFTPDGRWVVSGGFDNAVKVWDLTTGKLLHDFKFHGGHIMSINFHPQEFLMASASADRTVKFWDLETFELIGSSKREVTGTQSIAFHPDGRTLFTGHENGLKVYSWEPVICHDTVDMGWTTLGDLCIHDGKLLGCSYFQNSVGVWVADISLIAPYADASDTKKKTEDTEQKLSLHGSKLDKVEDDVPTSGLHSMSPDESKEIKNIYIDCKPLTLSIP